jgi:hypothetical protein
MLSYALLAPVRAQDFKIDDVLIEAPQRLSVRFQADAEHYYILVRGGTLRTVTEAVDMRLGAPAPGTLGSNLGSTEAAFFRVLMVPVDQPLDSDGDGIDDVFELRRPALLNPLGSADAALDPDRDGRSNLDEYRGGTDPGVADSIFSVRVLKPADASTVLAGMPLAIEVEASAAAVRVEVLLEDQVLAAAGARPFVLQWVNPTPGAYELRARAFDSGGRWALSAPVAVTVNVPPPVFAEAAAYTADMAYPLAGTTLPGLLVEVVGGLRTVRALADAAGRFVVDVPLVPDRLNRLFTTAIEAMGRRSAQAPFEIIHDSQPPALFIDFPPHNAQVTSDEIIVAGRVGDVLGGFKGLHVTVNGAAANVIVGIGPNGTFERGGIRLNVGHNRILATASDMLGNTLTREIAVYRVAPAADKIERGSGDGQQAVIQTLLAEPLIVRLTDGSGQAIANKLVTFEVIRSNGRLLTAPDPAQAGERMMQLATDAAGLARVYWRLGSDAGCGNNRVSVTSKDIAGTVFFCASAAPEPARQINVGSGNAQRVEAGGPAFEPLRAWVSDSCNGVVNVPVTFRVVRGGGRVNGVNDVTVPTSITGHAEVEFTLGPEIGSQIVEANFPGNPGRPAEFVLSALRRDPAAPTALSGIVLDNAANPVGGARTALIVNSSVVAAGFSDPEGQFRFVNIPDGVAKLVVDGLPATLLAGRAISPGTFPALAYELLIIPNSENALPMPVLLPPLNPANSRAYDGTQDVVLTVQGIEGLEMRVKAGSMRRADGSRPSPSDPAILALNQVHHDDVPMPMPDGAAPAFAWTLQPAGATFDPPIEIHYPNMTGLPAGAIAYFLSFNHDTERFEIVASGHVTEDGAFIVTDPGVGLSLAGWGCNCPPYSVTADCASSVGGTRVRSKPRDDGGEDPNKGENGGSTVARDPGPNPGDCIEYCKRLGTLTAGTAAREETVVCPNETIEFRAPTVSDSGGVKERACRNADGSVTRTELAIPPGPLDYAWMVSVNGRVFQRGNGPVARVTALDPGEYTCHFTVTATRDCRPSPLELNAPQIGRVINVDVSMQGLPEEDAAGATTTTRTRHETDPGAFVCLNDNDNDGRPGPDLRAAPLPLAQVDPDLEAFLLSITPNPGKGTATLTYPAGTQVWLDRQKAPVPKFSWDLATEMPPPMLYLEGIEAGMGDLRLTYSGTGTCNDGVKVSVIRIDLDVDSDNTRGLEPLTAGDGRTAPEDEVEDVENDPDRPGKRVALSSGDWDNDGIPDYADGFGRHADDADDDRTGPNGAEEAARFVPMVLALPATVDPTQARVRFSYDASDPMRELRTGMGSDADPYAFQRAGGALRVWTKDASVARNAVEVGASGGGDFVKPGSVYRVADLGPGLEIPLFLEALELSAAPGDRRIEVELDPNGPDAEPGFICADRVRATAIDVRFVNRGEEAVEFATGFSDPNPVVELGIGEELAPITLEHVMVDAPVLAADGLHAVQHARLQVRGAVRCDLADIVADRSADITDVAFRIFQVNSTGTKQLTRVPVQNVSPATLEQYRPRRSDKEIVPRPYLGRFVADLVIPVQPGDTVVSVEARNIIGNTGHDSFTLRVVADPAAQTQRLTAVLNHASTKPGLFNPIWVYIDDTSITPDNVRQRRAEFFGGAFPLRLRDGQPQIDRPFVQVGRPFVPFEPGPLLAAAALRPAGLRRAAAAEPSLNILNADQAPEPVPARYEGATRELEWTYTAASPPDYYYYAAGTTVKHAWYSKLLAQGWRVRAATVWELTGTTWAYSGERDPDSGVAATVAVPNRNGKGGIELSLQLKTSALVYPEKSLNIDLVKGGKRKRLKWEAEFCVTPLRTIIIGVDGLGDAAVARAVALGPTFNKVFSRGLQHSKPALAALPTVTWVNWPSIFTGNEPRAHGWTGNSWFPRETAATDLRYPLASANSTDTGPFKGIDTRQAAGVATGGTVLPDAYGMVERRLLLPGPGPGSLYDMIGLVAARPGRPLECRSVRMFYAHAASPAVNLIATHFGISDPTGHSPQDARTLDDDEDSFVPGGPFESIGTGTHAQEMWSDHRDALDVLAAYYPGPDNVAHAFGANNFDPADPLAVPAGWNPLQTFGAIGVVATPLPSVAEHARLVTDGALKRLVDQIEEDGYLNACLFALVADHGLVAYRNTDAFNITSEDDGPTGGLELERLFDPALGGLPMRMWRNVSGGPAPHEEIYLPQYQVVYSPNGGMGQFYLRSTGRSWQQPPLKADLEAVASLLYREAVGHAGYPTTQIYAELAPQPAKAATANSPALPATAGAFGDPPAVFVRWSSSDATDPANSSFMTDFLWVAAVAKTPPYGLTLGSIASFIAARAAAGNPVNWPAFAERMDESNHKNVAGSRTGDIIVIMDAEHGYLTVNRNDAFNGWHGGPTEGESYVPLLLGMPGTAVHPVGSPLPAFVTTGFNAAVAAALKPDGYLRSSQLAQILVAIIGQVRSPADP